MGKQGTGRARFPGCPSTLAIPGVFREAEVFLRSFRRRHLILPDMTWNRLFSSDFYPLPMRLGHFRRETSAYFHSLIRYSYYFSFEQKCSLIEQYFACFFFFFFKRAFIRVHKRVFICVRKKKSLDGSCLPEWSRVSRQNISSHLLFRGCRSRPREMSTGCAAPAGILLYTSLQRTRTRHLRYTQRS